MRRHMGVGRAQMALEALCAVVLLGSLAVLGALWGSVPAKIPSVYALDGSALAYGSRDWLWLRMLGVLAAYLALTSLAARPRAWRLDERMTKENHWRVERTARTALAAMKLLLVSGGGCAAIHSALGRPAAAGLGVFSSLALAVALLSAWAMRRATRRAGED